MTETQRADVERFRRLTPKERNAEMDALERQIYSQPAEIRLLPEHVILQKPTPQIPRKRRGAR